MPSWVGVTGFGGFAAAAWIAEIGPYLGPDGTVYPPPSAALVALGGAFGEIDYYVGDPVSGPLDNVTPTNLADSYVFFRTSTDPTSGTGTECDGNAGSHAGQTLWVALYPPGYPSTLTGPPPSVDPLELVYSGYGGGTLTTPPPGWLAVIRNSWFADCGLYIGPIPSAPPIPANFPVGADEIDYYIGIPNPLNPGGQPDVSLDMDRLSDGTAGNGPPAAGFTDNPANHLFVQVFMTSGDVPARAPLNLVPPSFVSGASGAPVGDPAGGHWEIILLINYPATGLVDAKTGRGDVDDPNTDPVGAPSYFTDTDPVVSEQKWINYLKNALTGEAGFPNFAPSSYPNSFTLDTFKPGESGSLWYTGEASLEGDMIYEAYQAVHPPDLPSESSLGDLPNWITNGWVDLSASWIEGIDFWAKPGAVYGDAPLYADYPDGYSAQERWQPFSTKVYTGGTNHNPGAENYESLTMELAIAPGIPSSTSFSPLPLLPWETIGTVSATLGTSLVEHDFDVTPPTSGPFTLATRTDWATVTPPFHAFSTGSTQAGWNAQAQHLQVGYQVSLSPIRVWVPGPAIPRSLATYLRMTQRNDNLGISQHPRLFAGADLPNRPQSVQQPHAPRLPQNPNTYS